MNFPYNNYNMRLNDFEDLTQYLPVDSLLYLQANRQKPAQPLAKVRYGTNQEDVLLVPGKKPLQLAQLLTRLSQSSGQAHLYHADGQAVLGFQVDGQQAIVLQ
ncbi:hypothetical protein OZX65_04575 [Leuconostocaceae bacterium ESL0723]|nr:hypothetical protein OZX65_04575 [Leuconostocaceae bacterium ESL0723]